MSVIIGMNWTDRPGYKMLMDAACCVFIDGNLEIAIASERITKIKYDGNIIPGIEYCLNSLKLKVKDIDYWAVSICGYWTVTKEQVFKYLSDFGIYIDINKIFIVDSHHLSHAYSAYYYSGFSEALCIVSDRDGSIIEGDKEIISKNRIESFSVYYGKNGKLQLLERDGDDWGEIGIGKTYSYITSFLGFDGYSDAGKVMGLASYGKRNIFNNKKILEMKQGKIVSMLECIDENKKLSVQNFFKENYSISIDPFENVEGIEATIASEIAKLAQTSLEEVLIKKFEYLIKKYSVSNICYSGGVALNCVANEKIKKGLGINNIFVLPSAGDSGQCIGNAVNVLYNINEYIQSDCQMKSTYLGKSYNKDKYTSEYLNSYIINKYDCMMSIVDDVDRKKTARLIFNDKIISVFNGKSEFGPRALGNRSILASPIKSNMKDILNLRVKHRESFRPFGASVLYEHACEYFDIDAESPFMLFAVNVNENKKNEIPAVVHVDGTCRCQTVTKRINSEYYNLINEFYKISNIPMVLNTSFNIAGFPIVETPEDAIDCFIKTDIDALLLYNKLLVKNSIYDC